MASLRRHPRTKYWLACFTGADGRRYQRSTGVVYENKVESRRKAQKIADTFEDAARQLYTARQTQSVICDLYQKATGEDLANQTVQAYAKQWLANKKGSVEEHTWSFYKSRVESLLASLGDKAHRPVSMVTDADVRQWRDAESERVSAKTANTGLKAIRMFFGDACKANVITHNPTSNIAVLKRKTTTSRRPFTEDEIRRLMEHLDPEWKSLVLFGLYTGQRLGDLGNLRWQHIDLTSKEIRFETGKTGRNQKIPIAPPLLRSIHSMPRAIRNDGPVHPAAFACMEVRKGKVGTLSRQFHDYMAKAGLVEKRKHRKKSDNNSNRREISALTFHSLRHTLTSLLKNAGVSSAIAEEIVGHESSEMNRIYTHIEKNSLVKAMELLPDLAG